MKFITYQTKKIEPSKIICIGRNYVEHIQELNNEIPTSMVVFNKPNSAISQELFYINDRCRFEGEICFLIQNSKIEGIGFGLDLTKADLQNYLKSKGLPWERAKAFDNSAVFSKFVPFEGKLENLRFELFINNKLAQFANYSLMIYKPLNMIDEIKSFMSFEDGDIIMSGTPKGVGYYKLGDKFEAKIYLEDNLILDHIFIAI
jgi:2-keto-4-pentenoate hydratase/2-oxohepta-3-ene-1,7-dioic acid hydratase in catechol pathway